MLTVTDIVNTFAVVDQNNKVLVVCRNKRNAHLIKQILELDETRSGVSFNEEDLKRFNEQYYN